MDTAVADAPDIAALSTAPVVEPSVAVTDPFKDAVRAETKSLPTPDELEQQGEQMGKTPEQTATALQRLRADAAGAYQKVADEYPDQAFARRAQADEDFNKRIAAQRDKATAQWAQNTFQNEDEFKNFATTFDRDPAAAAQENPQAAEGLNRILSHPAFQEHTAGPAMDIHGDDGTKYGWMQAHPDMHGGYDVYVNLANGKGSGSFKVKGKATKADAFKAFKESKIGSKAGEFHPIKGALASTAHGLENIGAAILSKVPGLEEKGDELRRYSRQKYEGNAKTTALGTGGDLTRIGEETAGKLPIWAFPGAGPVAFFAELYASSEARGKNLADDLEAQGKHEDAEKVRQYAWLYGAASAVTGFAAGKLLSLPLAGVVKLLPATTQKAFAKFISSLPGNIAAETANITAMELMQGQVVDPVFGLERAPLSNLINPGNLLFGAVFGGNRFRKGAKARTEREKVEKVASDVSSGTINSPQQIFDAIHGKPEETEPQEQAVSASEVPPQADAPQQFEAVASGTESGLTQPPVVEGDLLKDYGVPSMAKPKPAPPAPAARSPILSEAPMVGDTVAYNGYVGTLVKEGPRLEVHTDDGKIVEVEDNDPRLLKKVENPNPAGSYSFEGKSGWRFLKANITNSGRLNSVTLIHPDGSRTKVRGDDMHRIVALERERELAGKKIPIGFKIRPSDRKFTEGGYVSSAWFDAMTHGAGLIHQGVTDFTKWGREMVRKFGEGIRKHLRALWNSAVQYYYDVILPARGSIAAPGGHIAQPVRKFQDTTQPKQKGFFSRLNPMETRQRQKDVEEFRQALNEHGGEISAGNLAFDALQKQREKEGAKLDPAKFEKDSLLGAAIHVYRQVKGDTAILTDQRDQLKAKGGSQYVPVWEKALNLSAAEKAMADKVTEDYKQNALTSQAAGLAIDVDEAYGKQVWDLENNRGRAGFGDFLSRFDADPSSFKKKKHPTSFDGIMSGLTPKTLDDFKLVGVNGKEVNRAVATRKLAQRLPELRDSQGRPLAIIDSDQASKLNDSAVERLKALAASGLAIPVQMRSYTPYARYAVGGAKVENFDPTGYKPAGGRGVQGYYFQLPPPMEEIQAAQAAGGTAKLKNYYGRLLFHPEAFPYINARTAPSSIREIASRRTVGGYSLKGWLALNREIKASLLGALSAFHYVQEGFHGLGHGTNPLWNLPPVDPLNPEHLKWMKSGLMLGGEHDAIKYFDGGGDLDALLYRVPVLGYLSRKMSEHLFNHYIPALKLKTAQNAYERNVKRFEKQLASGAMTDAEVRHITSTAINDAYGHINWGDLGIGKSLRDFLQTVALAPDFLIARSRFAAQAAGIQRLRGVDASRASREAFMAFTALAFGQWATARLINWIINDGDMMTDAKSLFSVVDKKSGRRFSLRSVPGDVIEAVQKPVEFFNNRASPLVRNFYNVLMGTNWRGENVGHGAALTDAIVGAAPMTLQPALRSLTTSGQQSPTSRKEDLLKSIGLKINRYSQLGEAKSKAHDYMSTHGDKKGTDYHTPSVYNPMLFQLLDGDEEAARGELDKLTGGDARSMERVVKGFRASLFRHFTGDATHEVNFRREMSKTDDGKQLIKDADRQRVDAWRLFLKVGKVGGDLRSKYPGKVAEPTDATLQKARELRLKEVGS